MEFPQKIVSGAQTGADRAALDVAIWYEFPHGGWCPKGRKAEDGKIGNQYQLQETPSANYLQRTEWNVRDSDATVVFTLGREATGGSLRTIEFAKKHGKPWLHIFPSRSYSNAEDLIEFVGDNRVAVLNVAGSRESKEPGIYKFTKELLRYAFFWGVDHPTLLGGPGEG